MLLLWLAAFLYVGGVNPFWLLVALLLVLATCHALMLRTRGRHWALVPMDTAMALFALLLIINPFISALPAISIEAALRVGLLPLCYLVGRLALIAGWFHRPMQALWGISGVTLAFALTEFLLRAGVPYAVFEDPNVLGGLWAALVWIVCAQLMATQAQAAHLGEVPSRWWLALALLLAGLAASSSLSAQLCFFGALLLFTLLLARHAKKALWLSLALAASLVMLQVTVSALGINKAAPVSRLASAGEDGSIQHRLMLQKSAIEIAADHHWLGSGLGTFKALYPAYRNPKETSSSGDLAHNDYVQLLQEGGIPLFLSALGIVALALRRLWQLVLGPWGSAFGAEAWISAGYCLAALTLLAQAAFNFVFYATPLLMLLGFALARGEHRQPDETPLPTTVNLAVVASSPLWVTALTALALLIISTVGARAAFSGLITDDCDVRGCRLLREGRTAEQLSHFLSVTQPDWLPARYYYTETLRHAALATADSALRQRLDQQRAIELSSIIRAAPMVGNAYAELASLLIEQPALATVVQGRLPAGLAPDPLALLSAALANLPQHFGWLLSLARLVEPSDPLRSYQYTRQELLKWWALPNDDLASGIAVLRHMIPRAVGFGLCSDARAMAGALVVLVPGSALATRAAGISPTAPEEAGCGLGGTLPAE